MQVEDHLSQLSWEWTEAALCSLVAITIVGILLAKHFLPSLMGNTAAVFLNSAGKSVEEHSNRAHCSSPSCVRCSRYGNLLSSLSERFVELCRRSHQDTTDENGLTRIERFVRRKQAEQSDDEHTPNIYGKTDAAFVLLVPGLEAKCWHGNNRMLAKAVESAGVCDIKTIEMLRDEFEAVWSISTAIWKCNSTAGQRSGWRTLFLINQGQRVVQNSALCPKAMAVLERIGAACMQGCVFSNACFSVVEPGAHITPHHGPCNVRVRCHVPLFPAEGCWLRVGDQRRYWSDLVGDDGVGFFLFDDAFEHEVRHEGTPSDGARVVFLFDLWHPGLSDTEREAIKYLFPPEETISECPS